MKAPKNSASTPRPFFPQTASRSASAALAITASWFAWSAAATPFASTPAAPIDPATLPGAPTPAIQAGKSTGTPPDSPANRVDPNVPTSSFASVGSFLVQAGSSQVGGSGIAINHKQILTAAHLFDLDGDGSIDVQPSDVKFNLNYTGDLSSTVQAQSIQLHPDWTGFFNPAINDDLALVTLLSPLPSSLPILPLLSNPDPTLPPNVQPMILAGYGRSGNGDTGFSQPFTLKVKRLGANLLEAIFFDDEGSDNVEVFFYDFEDADDVNGTDVFGIPFSFGNDLETIVGPGDSGGPMFTIDFGSGQIFIAGINTATFGSLDGLYGDIGAGMWLGGYLPWIEQTAAANVPDASPGVASLALLALLGAQRWIRRS